MRMLTLPAGVLAGCISIAASPAAGQDTLEGQIGAGVGIGPEYEGADAYKPIPIVPLSLRYKGFGLQTAGQGLQLDVSGIRFIDFGPILQYRGGRDDDVDDPVVALLPEVDPAVEVGGFVAINLPFFFPGTDAFTFIGRASFDVADGHGGLLVEPALRYSLPIGDDLRLNFIGGTTFVTENYNETYFGVSQAASELSGLPGFDAGSGFKDVTGTFAMNYFFAEHWGLTGIFRVTRLVGDAADSPIVQDRGSPTQFLGGVAVTYRF